MLKDQKTLNRNLSPTSKPKPIRSFTPSKASYPAFAPQHLHRSTKNLTQIITIVSSVIAVCNDKLPPPSAQRGNELLRELREHANKLSEVHAMPGVTKESRQVMAKSSFAANDMKGLMKL